MWIREFEQACEAKPGSRRELRTAGMLQDGIEADRLGCLFTQEMYGRVRLECLQEMPTKASSLLELIVEGLSQHGSSVIGSTADTLVESHLASMSSSHVLIALAA